MHADVYVLSRPNVRYDGIVDSVGFGVQPDSTLVGSFGPGLPDVQRSLNWVHLATRLSGARAHSGAGDGAVPAKRIGRDGDAPATAPEGGR